MKAGMAALEWAPKGWRRSPHKGGRKGRPGVAPQRLEEKPPQRWRPARLEDGGGSVKWSGPSKVGGEAPTKVTRAGWRGEGWNTEAAQ